MELCREVGNSIEAVLISPPIGDLVEEGSEIGTAQQYSFQSLRNTKSDTTFSSKIQHLQQQNDKLMAEVSGAEEKLREETARREQVEENLKTLEKDLGNARNDTNSLREDKVYLSSRVKRLTQRLCNSDRKVRRALLVLQKCCVVDKQSNLNL